MPYTEQNQPYKKSEPLTSGPCGNHEIFTLRRNEGDSFKFNPTGHDIFILKGDGDNGRVTYVINAGRYYIQQDDKVIEIGRFGDDRENQAVTVGQGYGKICTVESFCRMEPARSGVRDPAWEEYAGRVDKMDRRLMALPKMASRAIGSVFDAKVFPRGYERQEVFDPNKALDLYFADPDSLEKFRVDLVDVDNFIPPAGSSRSLGLGSRAALEQYYIREEKYRSRARCLKPNIEYSKKHDMSKEAAQLIEEFVKNDTRGESIGRAMGFSENDNWLKNMTPRQSLEFIGHMMYELTKYDLSATNGRKNPADSVNSLDLLRSGLYKSSKQEVQPLGVCRNFSAAAKVLFGGLKTLNPNLKNVYCFDAVGAARDVFGHTGDRAGSHAWLDVVMVTGENSVQATTIDPTWVLKGVDGSLERYNQMDRRIGTHYRMFAGMKNRHGHTGPNYANLKDANDKNVRGYYEQKIDDSIKVLKTRYGDRNGNLSVSNIPVDDPIFETSAHMALELAIFGQSTNRYYPTNKEKMLILRCTDSESMIVSPEDEIVMIDLLVDIINDKERSWAATDRAKRNLRSKVGRLEKWGGGSLDSGLTKLFNSQNAGLDMPYDWKTIIQQALT